MPCFTTVSIVLVIFIFHSGVGDVLCQEVPTIRIAIPLKSEQARIMMEQYDRGLQTGALFAQGNSHELRKSATILIWRCLRHFNTLGLEKLGNSILPYVQNNFDEMGSYAHGTASNCAYEEAQDCSILCVQLA